MVDYSGVRWRAMFSPCSTCHNWSSCSTFLTRSARGNLVWPSHEAVTSSVFRENIITPPNIFCFANSACTQKKCFHITKKIKIVCDIQVKTLQLKIWNFLVLPHWKNIIAKHLYYHEPNRNNDVVVRDIVDTSNKYKVWKRTCMVSRTPHNRQQPNRLSMHLSDATEI